MHREYVAVAGHGAWLAVLFSCSYKLLMTFSYLLAEKISHSAMFSKTIFAIVSILRFISRINFIAELSTEDVL